MSKLEETLEKILDKVQPAHRYNGYWMGTCPVHNGDCLEVKQTDDKILLRCWGDCKFDKIVEALGMAGLSHVSVYRRTHLRRAAKGDRGGGTPYS